MDLFLTHFWLICGLWCGVGGAWYFRMRLKRKNSDVELTKNEIDDFTRKYAFWILVPCVILWMLQISAGSEFEPMFLKWPETQKTIALVLQIFVWGALIYWVFMRGGAETYSKYMRATQKQFNVFSTPMAIKLGTIAVVGAGIYALFEFKA